MTIANVMEKRRFSATTVLALAGHIASGFMIAALVVAGSSSIAAASQTHERRVDRRIEAPMEAVWSVLVDIEAWPSFIPGLRAVTVERGEQGEMRCRSKVASYGVKMRYTVTIDPRHDQGLIRVDLDPSRQSDIEALNNTWRLTPIDGGRATRVELVSKFRSGLMVPGFIERRALHSSVAKTLEGLAGEIERRRPATL